MASELSGQPDKASRTSECAFPNTTQSVADEGGLKQEPPPDGGLSREDGAGLDIYWGISLAIS